MNREFLLEAVIGITLGLLLVALVAITAPAQPGAGVWRRGVAAAGLIPATLAVPLAVERGVDLLGVVLLILVVAGALLAAHLQASRVGASAGPSSPVVVALRVAVATGVTVMLVTAAAQTLSIVARVEWRVVAISIAAVAALVVLAAGRVGAARSGGWAIGLLLVLAVLVLAIGAFLGSPAGALGSTVEVEGLGVGQWAALALAVILTAAMSPGTRGMARRAGSPGVVRGILLVSGTLLLAGFGLLMLFDGSIVGPSLQLSTLPANIDAVPGPMLVVLATLTVVFTASCALTLAGLDPHEASGDDADHTAMSASGSIMVAAVALAGVLIALTGPGVERALIMTGVLAAVGVALDRGGSTVSVPAAVVGLAVGLLCVVALVATDQLALGWPAAAASGLAALAVGALNRGRQPASELAHTGPPAR
jgi:hypothetical protein